ncbi:hypothetical protein AABC73_15095 [Pseudomonas sp. G.S.17]|uniref:hypothetical protein n=1 Tax=Pseudomonas sp. G.S.17 TaxID=3137451 RepID=UPI00311C89FC
MSALRKLQQRWDDMLPEEDGDFLESTAGKEWLEKSTARLMSGRDVMKPNPFGRDGVLVISQHLVESVANHLSANGGDNYAIERILIEVMRRAHKDDVLYQLASEALGVDEGECRVVQDLALEILSPLAEEYADAARDDDKAQSECGF